MLNFLEQLFAGAVSKTISLSESMREIAGQLIAFPGFEGTLSEEWGKMMIISLALTFFLLAVQIGFNLVGRTRESLKNTIIKILAVYLIMASFFFFHNLFQKALVGDNSIPDDATHVIRTVYPGSGYLMSPIADDEFIKKELKDMNYCDGDTDEEHCLNRTLDRIKKYDETFTTDSQSRFDQFYAFKNLRFQPEVINKDDEFFGNGDATEDDGWNWQQWQYGYLNAPIKIVQTPVQEEKTYGKDSTRIFLSTNPDILLNEDYLPIRKGIIDFKEERIEAYKQQQLCDTARDKEECYYNIFLEEVKDKYGIPQIMYWTWARMARSVEENDSPESDKDYCVRIKNTEGELFTTEDLKRCLLSDSAQLTMFFTNYMTNYMGNQMLYSPNAKEDFHILSGFASIPIGFSLETQLGTLQSGLKGQLAFFHSNDIDANNLIDEYSNINSKSQNYYLNNNTQKGSFYKGFEGGDSDWTDGINDLKNQGVKWDSNGNPGNKFNFVTFPNFDQEENSNLYYGKREVFLREDIDTREEGLPSLPILPPIDTSKSQYGVVRPLMLDPNYNFSLYYGTENNSENLTGYENGCFLRNGTLNSEAKIGFPSIDCEYGGNGLLTDVRLAPYIREDGTLEKLNPFDWDLFEQEKQHVNIPFSSNKKGGFSNLSQEMNFATEAQGKLLSIANLPKGLIAFEGDIIGALPGTFFGAYSAPYKVAIPKELDQFFQEVDLETFKPIGNNLKGLGRDSFYPFFSSLISNKRTEFSDDFYYEEGSSSTIIDNIYARRPVELKKWEGDMSGSWIFDPIYGFGYIEKDGGGLFSMIYNMFNFIILLVVGILGFIRYNALLFIISYAPIIIQLILVKKLQPLVMNIFRFYLLMILFPFFFFLFVPLFQPVTLNEIIEFRDISSNFSLFWFALSLAAALFFQIYIMRMVGEKLGVQMTAGNGFGSRFVPNFLNPSYVAKSTGESLQKKLREGGRKLRDISEQATEKSRNALKDRGKELAWAAQDNILNPIKDKVKDSGFYKGGKDLIDNSKLKVKDFKDLFDKDYFNPYSLIKEELDENGNVLKKFVNEEKKEDVIERLTDRVKNHQDNIDKNKSRLLNLHNNKDLEEISSKLNSKEKQYQQLDSKANKTDKDKLQLREMKKEISNLRNTLEMPSGERADYYKRNLEKDKKKLEKAQGNIADILSVVSETKLENSNKNYGALLNGFSNKNKFAIQSLIKEYNDKGGDSFVRELALQMKNPKLTASDREGVQRKYKNLNYYLKNKSGVDEYLRRFDFDDLHDLNNVIKSNNLESVSKEKVKNILKNKGVRTEFFSSEDINKIEDVSNRVQALKQNEEIKKLFQQYLPNVVSMANMKPQQLNKEIARLNNLNANDGENVESLLNFYQLNKESLNKEVFSKMLIQQNKLNRNDLLNIMDYTTNVEKLNALSQDKSRAKEFESMKNKINYFYKDLSEFDRSNLLKQNLIDQNKSRFDNKIIYNSIGNYMREINSGKEINARIGDTIQKLKLENVRKDNELNTRFYVMKTAEGKQLEYRSDELQRLLYEQLQNNTLQMEKSEGQAKIEMIRKQAIENSLAREQVLTQEALGIRSMTDDTKNFLEENLRKMMNN